MLNKKTPSPIHPQFMSDHAAESPLILDSHDEEQLLQGSSEIICALTDDQWLNHEWPQLASQYVPHEYLLQEQKPLLPPSLYVLDFALTDKGPQLIELQGFPSLLSYSFFLEQFYRDKFQLTEEDYTSLNSSLTIKEKKRLFQEVLLGHNNPLQEDKVVLLELDPEHQITYEDLNLTTELFPFVNLVNIRDVFLGEDKKLYYKNEETNHASCQIKRIFNRVLGSELFLKPDIFPFWKILSEASVQWVYHPNWFFRMSKLSLPYLHQQCPNYVPRTYFVNDVKKDLTLLNQKKSVLKAMFSCGGKHVNLFPSIQDVLEAPSDFIVQDKISYTPLTILSSSTPYIAEIRLMFLWPSSCHKPVCAGNSVRILTKYIKHNFGEFCFALFKKN